MADTPPPNYNSTPLTPPAGGTIHAMSGGGDGGAPAGYNPASLLPVANPSIPITRCEGGGRNDPALIAVGAVATKEANSAARNATSMPSVTSMPAVTTTTPAATTTTPAATTLVSNTPTDVSLKKQITLNGHKLTIGPPWDLSEGSKETEALAWFGVDKTSDEELKKEVLQALYDGVCDTDKPLIMILECEPIRRLVQSLAEKLLGNLTRPVVKNTPAVVAAKELQSATLMTFNVFKNQCKTKTAKDYIDSSTADIICTQQDNKTELANYTEIKACGTDDNTQRVYLKKGLSYKIDSECITVGDNSAVLFTYQGVTIVNMGSSDQKILEEVLKKDPHIILGNVDGLLEKGYVSAEPSNKDLIKTDAIWYKPDQDLFELKDTIIPNIIVKTDQYTDPVSCSYSDHNPITTVIHFKKTIKKLLSNADQAAIDAAKAAATAAAVGSRAMEALEGNQSVKSKSFGVESSGSAQGTQSKSGEEEVSVEEAAVEEAVSEEEAVAAPVAVNTATSAAAAMKVAPSEVEEEAVVAPVAMNAATSAAAAMKVAPSEVEEEAATEPVAMNTATSAAAAMKVAPSEVEVASVAADSIFDDEMAKKIAIAAVAVIMNSFVKTKNKISNPPIQVPALNDFTEKQQEEQQQEEQQQEEQQGEKQQEEQQGEKQQEEQQQEEQLLNNENEAPPPPPASNEGQYNKNNNAPPPPPPPLSLLSSTLAQNTGTVAPPSSIKPVSSSTSYQPEFDDFLSQINNDLSPIKPQSKSGTAVSTSSSIAPIAAVPPATTSSTTLPATQTSPVLPSSPIKTYTPRRKYRNNIPQYSEILEKSLPEYKSILGNDPTIQRTLTILDRIDTLRDKTYNDKIRNQDTLSSIRRELNDHSKDLRSKLLAYVTTPSNTRRYNGKKIGRNSVSSILTKTMNDLGSQLLDIDDTLSDLKEVTLEDDPLFKEINKVSRGLPSSSVSAPLPAVPSLPVPPPSSINNSNKALTSVKKTITGTIEGITGKSTNLTENFKKRNALTAELKQEQKKFRGLNQQLRNEGVNFRSSPAKNEASVAEPVAEPVSKSTNAVSVKKQPTANELNAELLKNLQKRPSKKTTLSEEDKIKIQMKTLTKVIDAKKTQIRFQLQSMNHENDGNRVTEREIESQMKLIDQRMEQINDLMENPKVHSETIKQYQKECYDKIEKINGLITRIQPKEGGKRRTQKKRKQKKRFGTQKNNKK